MEKTVMALSILLIFLSFGTNTYAYHIEMEPPGFNEHWDEVEAYYNPGSGYSVNPMGNVIDVPFRFIVMPDAGDNTTGLIGVEILLSLKQENSLEIDNFDTGGYEGHTINSASAYIDQGGLYQHHELNIVPGSYAIATSVEIGEWCNVTPDVEISGCLYWEDWYNHVIDNSKSGYAMGKYSTKLEVTGANLVPEPSTLLLLAAGLIGLAGLRRKKGIH